MKNLDTETKTFLTQALRKLTIKEADFIPSWLAIQNLLNQSTKTDGSRMFHWVGLHIATVEVCPTSTSKITAIGRFVRYEGDLSGADYRAFEIYE